MGMYPRPSLFPWTRCLLRFCAVVFGCFTAATLPAQSSRYAVQAAAQVRSDPPRVELRWVQEEGESPVAYQIQRKRPQELSWNAVADLPGAAAAYTDATIQLGEIYEYQIIKSAGNYKAFGYVQAGGWVPLTETRGKVVLIVDRTRASPLATELARLEQDLVGDGWGVIRHEVERTDTPGSVRALIKADYDRDPSGVKAVFLFGRVPVPYAGRIAPDGHTDHVGAWPADVYYGDMDTDWSDSAVAYVQSANGDPMDAARLTNLVGDGKFDQSGLPSWIELQVGRVDLSNMPGKVGGLATFPSETELLRQYLEKDHAFRHRHTAVPDRAVVGDYFGAMGGEAFAASGYRSFAPLVAPENIVNLNTLYSGATGVWITTLSASEHLLAFGSGPGVYTGIGGIGSTTDIVSSDPRAVFTLMCGSWFGDWDHEDDVLRAMLATRSRGLTAAWSGRPHWFLHPMGLGETIGYCAQLTQNNGWNVYANQLNAGAGLVHVALMGDPTLRLHPVTPPGNLTNEWDGRTAALSWAPSPEPGAMYNVYRSEAERGPYNRVNSEMVAGTAFTDASAEAGGYYMVRAVVLKETSSGSYYNASQGVFCPAGAPPPDVEAPSVAIIDPVGGAVLAGSAVELTVAASDNVAVLGLQLQLDGVDVGPELTMAPYRTMFDSTLVPDGVHRFTAVVRDAAGNRGVSSPVEVMVANVAPSAFGDVAWFDDALPGGVNVISTGGTWVWVNKNPAPFASAKALQSPASAGLAEYGFSGATTPLAINSGDTLFAYVYIDPAHPPAEIMLSWQSGSWEHRAYWGANRITQGKSGSASRRHMGRLPDAGKWVLLTVPAEDVDLQGAGIFGLKFSVFGGRATLDFAGKSGAKRP